jgi:hypothetical protein
MAQRSISDIPNTFERRATLIVDALYAQAERMVDAMNEPPPGMQEPDAATVRMMWDFSPFPHPEQAFWELHDVTLQPLIAQVAAAPIPGDQRMNALRQAHQQAELAALQKVYPQRAKLALLGVTTIERSVKLAERAARLSQQQQPPSSPAPQEAVTY